jgi:HAD superfamily hydrolase (TIGR01509 family)
MRKFLLWDHDGVLVDTERWYFAATKECLNTLGVELEQETYLRFMAQGRSCWDLAIEFGAPEVTVYKARRDRDRRYQEMLATEPIEVDGVLDVLSELRSQYRMAIVSTSKRADFDLIHKSRKIRAFFEFVINIEDCERAKPAPDPYLRALERFRATPLDALAIEDSSRGLAAATSAGLPCAMIKNNFTAPQDFTGAWRILDSIWQLPDALAYFSD